MTHPLPASPATFKIPESVLVVIHTPEHDVLLIRRADWGTWQSVTGSKDHPAEDWQETAIREVQEETGIDARHPSCRLQDWQLENVYDIYPAWRWRYAPGVSPNACPWCSAPASTPKRNGCPGKRPLTSAFPRPTRKPF